MADAAPPPGFLSGFPPVLVAEAPAAPVPIWRVRGAEAVPAPAAAGSSFRSARRFSGPKVL